MIAFRRRDDRDSPRGHALDVYTRPSRLPAAPSTGLQAKAWPSFDDIPTHPGHGLEPRTVTAVFRAAEMGLLFRQADLFDDVVESDGHLRSLIESRRDAVAGKERSIQAGAQDDASLRAASILDRRLRGSLNFQHFVQHQLSSPYYGYAASEIEWELTSDGWLPRWFHNVPHRRFALAPSNELRLVEEGQTYPGAALSPGRWVVSTRQHHNLARAGMLRTATWWALFKRMSVRDWVIFAERFGVPFAIGMYEERSGEESRKALEEALTQLGNAGQVVISDATKIVFSDVAQRSGDTSAVHPALIALCEAQMSKLINGATQNVETGTSGSYAQARVHEARALELERADAENLELVFSEHVSIPFLRFNGFPEGTAPPLLHMQVVREWDPGKRLEQASCYANELGGVVDDSQLRAELGFRRPTRVEDELRGTKTAKATSEEPADA